MSNDQDETPQEKAEAFLKEARYDRDAVMAALGMRTLDAATFQYMLDHKMLLELKQSDMSPAYGVQAKLDNQHRYSTDTNADGSFKTPIYVIPGIGNGRTNVIGINIQQGDGTLKRIVLSNEGNHIFDAAYYREYMLPSDAELTQDTHLASVATLPDLSAARAHGLDVQSFIATEAARLGIEAPQLLVKDERWDRFVTAQQSKEGHNYIIVSQRYLEETNEATQGKATAELKANIRKQMQQIHDGAFSPQTQAQRQQDSSFITSVDGTDYLPDSTLRVSNATLARLQKNKTLIPIPHDELLPTTDKTVQAVFDAKDATGKPLPVYVSRLDDYRPTNGPEARRMKTKEGQEYILVNEDYHRWTEAYAKDTYIHSDAFIQGKIDNQELYTSETYLQKLQTGGTKATTMATASQRLKALSEFIAQRSAELGIDNPQLLINTAFRSASPGFAETTKEGKNIVTITSDVLMNGTNAEFEAFKGVVGHELAHLKDGDSLPAGYVYGRNAAVARYEELKADLVGAGPLGTHNPEAAAAYMHDELVKMAHVYWQKNPSGPVPQNNPTDAQLQIVSKDNALYDIYHPPMWERRQALLYEARMMKEYEATHTVVTLEDRKKESDFVVNQTIDYMKDKWPTPMEPPQALPGKENPSGKIQVPQFPAPDKGGLSPQTQEQLALIQKVMTRTMNGALDLAAAPLSNPLSPHINNRSKT